MSEEHDNKVCQANYEQLPNRWNNSWPHIPLQACCVHPGHIFPAFGIPWPNPIVSLRLPTWREKPGLASRTPVVLLDADRRGQR